MVGSLSLARLGVGLAVFLLRVSDAVAHHCLKLASAQGQNRLIVFDDVENPDDLKSLVLCGKGCRSW